jgi:hypothetical protein
MKIVIIGLDIHSGEEMFKSEFDDVNEATRYIKSVLSDIIASETLIGEIVIQVKRR